MPLRELVSHALDLAPGRAEERERSACPDEDPDVESLGQLREHIAKDKRGSLAHERKVGREVPAGDVHVRARCLQRIGDRRQCFGSVDEDLDRVARTWRRRTLGPAVTFRVQGALPAEGAQAPGVVRGDLVRDGLADNGFARHELRADALPEALGGSHEARSSGSERQRTSTARMRSSPPRRHRAARSHTAGAPASPARRPG